MNARPTVQRSKKATTLGSPKLAKSKGQHNEVEEYFHQKQKLRLSIENMVSRTQAKKTSPALLEKDGIPISQFTHQGFMSKQLISTDASSETPIGPQGSASL
jgi:hypothetical protein